MRQDSEGPIEPVPRKSVRWSIVLILSVAIVAMIIGALAVTAYLSDHPRSLTLHGNYHLWRQNYAAALDCFEKVALKQPESAEAWYDVGRAYEGLHHWEEAIEAYRKTIQLAPDHTSAHYQLGMIYVRLNDRAAAIRHRDILNILDPRRAKLLSKRLTLMQ